MKPLSRLTATVAAVALYSFPALAGDEPVADTPATVDEAAAATETEAPGVPALWKVADEDTTIFLFGTVHTLPAEVDWRTEAVDAAMGQSGSLVTEIDMTPETMANVGTVMASKGMLENGQTLRALMTEEQRATYEAGLAKVNIPANAFDTMEPWFAAIALLQVLSQAAGFSPDRGVENVLEGIFEEGTERVALETPEFQISVFDELPVEQQVVFLLGGAEDPIESIGALNTIVTLWSEGRVDELGELMREGFEPLPDLAESLVYNRNANWAEWIDTRLDEPGTVFMAVGALHLSGERSVQDLLAERGIETQRVQ